MAPFYVSIQRDGTDQGLPVEGLLGVSEIVITFEAADANTTITISDLFVCTCLEGISINYSYHFFIFDITGLVNSM